MMPNEMESRRSRETHILQSSWVYAASDGLWVSWPACG